ncbi:hypothetical protein [Streptomyces lydicus]|uniref:hypothetical protein n=1 Tax=Streptomyces lydicus TaxID=47763 RepID=UPI0037CCFE68
MADAGVGALPVVHGEEVLGLVTDRDLVVRAMAHGLPPADGGEGHVRRPNGC